MRGSSLGGSFEQEGLSVINQTRASKELNAGTSWAPKIDSWAEVVRVRDLNQWGKGISASILVASNTQSVECFTFFFIVTITTPVSKSKQNDSYDTLVSTPDPGHVHGSKGALGFRRERLHTTTVD